MPVDADVDDQQRGEGEGDNADRRQDVSEMAPVRWYEVKNATGDEGKSHCVRARHPLAMHDDMPVARSEKGRGGADHPGNGLHRGPRQTRTAPRECDPREGANKHGDDVDASEHAMQLDVTLANTRRKIDGADQEGEDSGQRVRDEELTIGYHLQTVGMVHRIVGDEENF